MGKIKLVSFKAESFGKIDSDHPVIITWPDDCNIVKLEGDQAVGKSSTLAAFIACCGGEIIENATNKKDGKRKAEFEFEKDDHRYKVVITNTRFELSSLINDRWAKLPSPKQALEDVLGPVGSSPMFLKNMSGKDQIQWLRQFRKLSQEEESVLAEINAKVKETYDGRKDAKRLSKQTDQQLLNNTYYVNRSDWEKRFAEYDANDADKILSIQDRHAEYQRSKSAVELLENNLLTSEDESKRIAQEIESLEKRLLELKEQKAVVDEKASAIRSRISTGKKYLEDNKSIIEEYNSISKIIEIASEISVHKAGFNQMKELEESSRHYHEEHSRLTAKLVEQRAAVKSFIAETFPKFDGLEIFVPSDAIDEGEEAETREGIYYNGCSMTELSESELWSFYLVLLRSMNIKVVLIENLSSLGSGAIDMLNYYASTGGYIMATEMKRDVKSLKIEVTQNIV